MDAAMAVNELQTQSSSENTSGTANTLFVPSRYFKHAWNKSHTAYSCRDNSRVCPVRKTTMYVPVNAIDISSKDQRQIPKNYIRYLAIRYYVPDKVLAVVSGTLFDRDMEKVVRETPGVTTILLPRTALKLRGGAFRGIKSFRAAAFPEGLETLNVSAQRGEAEAYMGIFEQSGLEHVRLPSTLRSIGARVF